MALLLRPLLSYQSEPPVPEYFGLLDRLLESSSRSRLLERLRERLLLRLRLLPTIFVLMREVFVGLEVIDDT